MHSCGTNWQFRSIPIRIYLMYIAGQWKETLNVPHSWDSKPRGRICDAWTCQLIFVSWKINFCGGAFWASGCVSNRVNCMLLALCDINIKRPLRYIKGSLSYIKRPLSYIKGSLSYIEGYGISKVDRVNSCHLGRHFPRFPSFSSRADFRTDWF